MSDILDFLNGPQQRELFTASRVWVPPAGVYKGLLTLVAAGGGGNYGAGSDATDYGGGGGGGGEVIYQIPVILHPGQDVAITIGAGGAAGVSGAATGGTGGYSAFTHADQYFQVAGGHGIAEYLGGAGGGYQRPAINHLGLSQSVSAGAIGKDSGRDGYRYSGSGAGGGAYGAGYTTPGHGGAQLLHGAVLSTAVGKCGAGGSSLGRGGGAGGLPLLGGGGAGGNSDRTAQAGADGWACIQWIGRPS